MAVALLGDFVTLLIRTGKGDVPVAPIVVSNLFYLGILYLVLRGSRIAWTILVVLSLGALAIVVAAGRWPEAVFYAILLPLLLAPNSQRYVWGRQGGPGPSATITG